MSSRGDADITFIDQRSSAFGVYGQGILNHFILSDLHKNRSDGARPWVNRPKGAACICVFSNYTDSNKEVVIFKKEGGQHVAEMVCEYILKLDMTNRPKVHFYFNLSTCDSCSDTLIALKEAFPDIEFQITFSALYLIERPSCKDCYCRDPEANSSKDDNNPEEVLKHLKALARKIPVQPFNTPSWLELEKLLAEWDRQHGRLEADLSRLEDYRLRSQEDRKMLQDCKKLGIPLRNGTSQDKSDQGRQSFPVTCGRKRKNVQSSQSLPVTRKCKKSSSENDIYLLHGEDGEEVRKVREIIKRNGWSVMTPQDGQLGQLQCRAREEAVKTSRHVLIVLTKGYIKTLGAVEELTHEIALQSPHTNVISIVCCDRSIVPDALTRFVTADIDEANLEERLQRVINSDACREEEESG